jgi:hypothetical protein
MPFMASERMIVVGLEDAKALRLECTNCKTSITISPPFSTYGHNKLDCPECHQRWLGADSETGVFWSLLGALSRTAITGEPFTRGRREHQRNFRIRIEFEEPTTSAALPCRRLNHAAPEKQAFDGGSAV